jgi:hypothetical protein
MCVGAIHRQPKTPARHPAGLGRECCIGYYGPRLVREGWRTRLGRGVSAVSLGHTAPRSGCQGEWTTPQRHKEAGQGVRPMTWTMDQIRPSPERCGEMWTRERDGISSRGEDDCRRQRGTIHPGSTDASNFRGAWLVRVNSSLHRHGRWTGPSAADLSPCASSPTIGARAGMAWAAGCVVAWVRTWRVCKTRVT